MEKYAVIMAGGAGLRLWPLSRENKPKQFICIDGNKSMLVQTVERINEIIPPEKCFIITNSKLLDITRDTLEGLIPPSNIISEPMKKNTAACIAYASMLIRKKYGPGLLCCVPADGCVKDIVAYRRALELSYSAAACTGNLVIIGITPVYPATGYGYIHIDMNEASERSAYKVLRFKEKPDIETAKNYVLSGDYLWNGGIVTGDTDVIIDNIRSYLPKHYNKLNEALDHADDPDFNTYIDKAYHEMDDISFDTGVLEKSECIHAVKGLFDWDDIGSFDALGKTLQSDAMGNSTKGSHYGLGTTNSVIYGHDSLIATVGLNDMIIVCTNDAIIICPREKAQDIKVLVEKLKFNGFEKYI